MANLVEVLRQQEFTDLTDQEAVDFLLEQVEIYRDSTAYTWSGTNEKLGEMGLPLELVSGWDTVITQLSGGSMLDRMLASGGINYSLQTVRLALGAVLQGTQDATIQLLAQSLLNIGIRYGYRWVKLGLVGEPSLSDVQAARARIVELDTIIALEDMVRSMRNANQTMAEIKTAVTNEVNNW